MVSGNRRMRYRPKRWDTEAPVTLRANAGDRTVTAVSVSSTGLRIRPARGLVKGEAVTVLSGDAALAAHVVWINADEAGLEWGRPLTRQAIAAAGLRRVRPQG